MQFNINVRSRVVSFTSQCISESSRKHERKLSFNFTIVLKTIIEFWFASPVTILFEYRRLGLRYPRGNRDPRAVVGRP